MHLKRARRQPASHEPAPRREPLGSRASSTDCCNCWKLAVARCRFCITGPRVLRHRLLAAGRKLEPGESCLPACLPACPAACLPGSPAARQPGSPAARQPGSLAARQPGSPAARQPACLPGCLAACPAAWERNWPPRAARIYPCG